MNIKRGFRKILERILFNRKFVLFTLVLFYFKTKKLANQNKKNSNKKYKILALNPDRFRGDLNILNDVDDFCIVTLPFNLHAWMINTFYNFPERLNDFYQPRVDSNIYLSRIECRAFLRLFLFWYYKFVQIDCVLGAAVHFKHDFDWGAVTNQLNIPFIVLHRENLIQCIPGPYKFACQLYKMIGSFEGAKIVVHNNESARCFVEAGYANKDQVLALGCMRMDLYLNQILKSKLKSCNNRKKVSFFSFSAGTNLYFPWMVSGGFQHWPDDKSVAMYSFFDNSILAIGQLALENPEIDFIIKPKIGHPSWDARIEKALHKGEINYHQLSNLSILPFVNPHELILESDVVCGFGSTVLLEAGIAKKPVVMPLFDEAQKPEFSDYILFGDYLEMFKVAYSSDEFKTLILDELESPSITDDQIKQREKLFNQWVSGIDGMATKRYTELIKSEIRESKKYA
jgi:hypothetical protein